jgi:hypothetical protein
LARDGLCPECAAPVAVSAHEDFLCFAEPHYVARLARGNRWISRGLTLSVIAALLLFLGAILISGVRPASGLDELLVVAWALLGTISLLAGLLWFLAGVWLVTSVEPGTPTGWRRDRARKLVRAYLVVGTLAVALDIWLEEVVPPVAVVAACTLLSIGCSVFGVIGLVAYFHYVRDVAARLPDRRFAARAGALAWNLAVVVGTLVLLSAANRIVSWGPALFSIGAAVAPTTAPPTATAGPLRTPLGILDTCFGGTARLVALVLFVRAIRLHAQLRKPLQQQAVLAEQHWDASTKPV